MHCPAPQQIAKFNCRRLREISTVLVTGTLAIDYIAKYPGSFARLSDHVGINVSTRVEQLERQFGGCAMNISYSLSKLGHTAIPFVLCGSPLDHSYSDHICAVGVDRRGIVELNEWSDSSHGFIFTDQNHSQFTAFYSGPAESNEYESRLQDFLKSHSADIDYAILAPDIAPNMICAATLLNQCSIPFLTDPGQQVSDFTDDDCVRLIGMSQLVIGNEFEVNRLRSAIPDLEERLGGLIVTLGSNGASWNIDDENGHERAAHPRRQLDPTGCGDAFRAGLVHSHLSGAQWRDAVRSGALVASISMGYLGSQNHELSNFTEAYVHEWRNRPSWICDKTEL
ncbi:MAG: PfkB family carbohydrate kinase [Gammaproteobacteria bacterium]|nr:PfkB family carbohydrate kinase [Gammaproteobacteria bacterium]